MKNSSAAAPKVWIKYPKPRGFDSAARCQRNLFAFRVMLILTGGLLVCPCCKRPMFAGGIECDRTIGGQHDERGEIYTEGFVVYICLTCNQERSALQTAGSDWDNVERYKARVLAASALVTMPTTVEAKAWQASKPWPVRVEPDYVNEYA